MSKQQNSMKMIWLQSVNALNVLLLGRMETDAMDKLLWLAWVWSSWGGGGPVGLWEQLLVLLHLRVCSFFRTSRWLPCRSGGDRKEPGRPAVDPRKGAGPQVKRNQSSDNACCNVSLLPHIVAKAQIEKKKEVSKSSWADIYCQINNRFQWFAS